MAELWALCIGLKMAARQNVTHILVEFDSTLVVNLVKGEWDDTHPFHGLLTVCKTLWLRNWDCSIVHIYRECNISADGLANYGPLFELRTQFL